MNRVPVNTETFEIIGAESPNLPEWLSGIGASEEQILDTTWAGYPGLGFWPIVDDYPFNNNPALIIGPSKPLTVDANNRRIVRAYTLVDRPPDPSTDVSIELLTEALTSINTRYAISGTLWKGLPIRTDDSSQTKYLAELAAITQGVRQDPDLWEFGDTVLRPISNADFPQLAIAAREHVRACFGVKGYVKGLIDDKTITKIMQLEPLYRQVLETLEGEASIQKIGT